AHYMMGGLEFEPDCRTAMHGLFAAGEDTGGVHGANRLGGNGVANSTVFGGIAGDTMAAWLRHHPGLREPDGEAVARAVAEHERPLMQAPGDLESIRERLFACMWDEVGILRDASGLQRAEARLRELQLELQATGVGGGDRAFHMSWHDWMNLRNLVQVSRAITAAALQRENSRGAHFREDHPEAGDLAASTYTVVREVAGEPQVRHEPVAFSRVRPGESLLDTPAAA
ncbi:MAG: FAD-binding protein, partial [Betaproteobacteria bacterium]|nr:FAD-binding protein [Betaproteobacteria bacterium]